MSEIIARRVFTLPYIFLDSAFLLLLLGLLLWKKRNLAAIVGLLMGMLYMIVDYGIFHLLLGTRSIEGGDMFWTLLWMSMSYGFTNFVWIWLWLDKDEHLFEWSLLILLWWFVCPIISTMIDGPVITIERTTGAYHGYMAIILFVGYIAAIIWNLKQSREHRIDIPWILAIGILVQFAWEAALFIGGIRSQGLSLESSIRTMITNSLLETNLGMPYVYFIHIAITRRWNEDLSRRSSKPSFLGRIEETNKRRKK